MMFHIKKLADAAAYPIYVIRGRKPWTMGYYTAKSKQIEMAIDSQLLKPGKKIPTGYGISLDERIIEYPWLYSRLPSNPNVMLDAGSALNHEFLVSRPPVSESKLTICTLAPEKRCYYQRGISYVFDDLRSSRFRSEVFDTIVSISTIEHIGLDNTILYTSDESKSEGDSNGYREAVREFRRIIRPGGECFITVPYGKASVHGWYQIFDDSMIQAIVEDFKPSRKEIDYFGYWADGWRYADSEELANATCYDPHHNEGYAPDHAAFARGVACLHLVA